MKDFILIIFNCYRTFVMGIMIAMMVGMKVRIFVKVIYLFVFNLPRIPVTKVLNPSLTSAQGAFIH